MQAVIASYTLPKPWVHEAPCQIIPWRKDALDAMRSIQETFASIPIMWRIPFIIGLTEMILHSTPAAAANPMERLVWHAMQPVINVVQAIGDPVAYLMLIGSFLLIMVGNRRGGIKMLKWAGIGYIGLHFVPVIMEILTHVGEAMRTGM